MPKTFQYWPILKLVIIRTSPYKYQVVLAPAKLNNIDNWID
jgi:hypothetical protein